jgi:squalene synthase HpnC
LSVDHYENFPVASLVLPGRLRPPVIAIYRFARYADDLADEGNCTVAQRLAALEHYRRQLAKALAGATIGDAILDDLAQVARQWGLPHAPLFALLDAFTQDLTQTRYASYAELQDYCTRSANPIGRLLLVLYGIDDDDARAESDAICTALQLINFWQDIALDLAKGRVYLPLAECRHFGVDTEKLGPREVGAPWQALLRFQHARARALLCSGAPLCRRLPGRIGFELKLIVEGGLRILEKLARNGGEVFTRRPTLRALDWPLILARAALRRWSSP